MDTNLYLSLFQQAVDKLDKRLLNQKQLQVETGVWLNSVVLRLHKQHWANNPDAKPQTGPAIFFLSGLIMPVSKSINYFTTSMH